MGEHRRLGRAGRAAGEHQRGDVVGRDAGDGQRLAGRHVVERDGAVDGVAVDGDHVLDASARAARSTERHVAGRAAVDDDGDGVDDGQLLLQLGRRARRVERDGDGAEADHGQVGDDERVAVAAGQGDAVAVADAEARQPAAQRRGPRRQLVVGDRLVAADRARRGRRRARR